MESEEEYLKKHLTGSSVPNIEQNIIKNDSTVSDLSYIAFDIMQLPCGRFYPQGTTLMVRPAKVIEIQAYSTVDDTNFHDVVDKMNDMLQSCARVKYMNGSIGTYLDIKDQDRLYTIFLIRELTFQKGSTLAIDVECCGEEPTKVELVRANFRYHDIDQNIFKYYNTITNCFNFELKNGKKFEVTPPTIGVQKAFGDYIMKENADNKKPNLAFLKIIPFMLGGRNSITYDGIKAKLKEFQSMDDDEFQFLNAAVSKLTFGIKELRKKCQCGVEVRTAMMFPNGASSIFLIPNAFEALIKE